MKDDSRTSPYAGPYDSIHIDDHDDSSTEVDETVDLNEKDYLRPRRTSWLAIMKEYSWVLNVFLLLVVIVLLLDGGWHKHGKDHYFEGAGDLTGFAPECELVHIIPRIRMVR